MTITDSEILELEILLHEQRIESLFDGLTNFDNPPNPNYKFLYTSLQEQEYNSRGELIKGFRGCVLEGSSRSGKTWSGVDFIIHLCINIESNATINIYRQTYTEFKETLYEDFKRRLDDFDLPNPFHEAKEIKSFKIGRNKIAFIGCDKVGKAHGAGCDYAFFNEMMHIPQAIFDQVEMRCRKFWWCDYNPSFTDHYVFDNIVPRSDVGFLRTTFLQNPFLSIPERNKILAYNPWKIDSYEVTDDGVYYRGEPITDKNQPPIHELNWKNGTKNEFMWKVYGLGLRGAMKGVIFEQLEWIKEFPNIAHTYANDFGFTADPNALVKYAEDSNNIYLELLTYKPIETPEELAESFEALGVEKHNIVTCDSSDKYTGENKGTVEMVSGLKKLGYRNVKKVSKTKSIMYWLTSMRKKRIHVVKNHLWKQVKKERENYIFKEIHGIMINQPIDKYNHFWDSARYGHIAHNTKSSKAMGSRMR